MVGFREFASLPLPGLPGEYGPLQAPDFLLRLRVDFFEACRRVRPRIFSNAALSPCRMPAPCASVVPSRQSSPNKQARRLIVRPRSPGKTGKAGKRAYSRAM